MLINQETQDLAKDLIAFMQAKFALECLPRVHFISNKKNSKNILGMTGGYEPDGETITVYVADRHPKDILRSLAHEMMHHVQKCKGMMDGHDMSATADKNYIMHDDFLKKLEAHAFKYGNIAFREWEASKKGDNTMNETKIPKSKLSDYKKEVSKAGEKLKGEYPEKSKWPIAATIAKKAVGVKEEQELDETSCTEEETVKENKEVQVNDALKNSHTYIPEDRPLATAYNNRDEKVFAELMKKFGIKK